MSRQFSFYLTPQDSFNLKIILEENLDVVFLADKSGCPKPSEFSELIFEDIEEEAMVYVSRRSELAQVRFHNIENLNVWMVDSLRSPVIEFSNCYFDKKRLGPGRMYYTLGYYLTDGSWTDKNVEFLEFARKVFTFTKKNLIRNKEIDAYLGKEAIKLLGAGKVKLSEI
jgi:hypothetical protein